MIPPYDRVIMISGANRGIGLAVTELLIEHGYRVSLGARDVDTLDALKIAAKPDQVACFTYDAFDLDLAKAWVAGTARKFGRIDGLINNAGISKPSFNIEEEDATILDLMISVNIKGPLRLIRLALPHLIKSGSGRVVNVSSLSGKRVKNSNFGYAMTKFSVVALTHAVRRHGWDYGVRATSICPGYVQTDMTAKASAVAGSDMIQPQDLAVLIETALSLPNNAAVAEMLVNCRFEDQF